MNDSTKDASPIPPPDKDAVREWISRWHLHLWSVSIAIAAVFVFGSWAYQIWDVTPDQSFVSLRYADHLRHGSGLVWNEHESPAIEGYVNPLWIALNAWSVPEAISSHLAAKAASVAITLLMAMFVFFWTHQACGGTEPSGFKVFAAGFASSIFLLIPGIPTAAVSGSELPLAALSLTLLMFYSEWYVARPKRSHAIALVLLSLSTILLRPELAIPVATILFVVYLVIPKRPAFLRQTIFPAMAILIAWFVWRAIRAGALFPLATSQITIQRSSLELGYSLLLSAILGMAVYWLFGAIAAFRLLRRDRTFVPVIAGLLSCVLTNGFIAGSIRSEIPVLFPVYPVVCMLAAIGFFGAVRTVASRHFLPLVITAFIGLLSWHVGQFSHRRPMMYENGYNNSHVYIPLGQILQEFQIEGDRTIALDEAGAVGYFSRWNVLALNGRINRGVNGTNESTEYSADVVLRRGPSIVALVSREAKTFRAVRSADSVLYRRADDYGYRHVAAVRMHNGHSLWILASHANIVRPLHRAIAERLPLTFDVSTLVRQSKPSLRSQTKTQP